jgi:CHASE2 domain-containing sensor protein
MRFIPALTLTAALAAGPGSVLGGDAPLRAVFIDSKTEALDGAFPLPRSLLARGINEIQKAGAKGLVIKFFFDQPNQPTDLAGDKRIGESIGKLTTVLEACLNDKETEPNPLLERFLVKDYPASPAGLLGAARGWIPVPVIARQADGIGFVDYSDPNRAPLVERYDGRVVKTLALCGLELVTGTSATFVSTNRVFFGLRSLAFDSHGQCALTFPKQDDLEYIPFHDILSGAFPKEKIKGAVVVLGYDGAAIHSITTPAGRFKAHRYWFYALRSLCAQLK